MASQLLVILRIAEDVIDHHQERMHDRNRGLLASSAQEEALLMRREVAVFRMDGGMSGFH
jgi:hypothetical protein